MNVLLLAGTILGIGALGLGAAIALLMAARLRAILLSLAALAWGGLYGTVLAVTSLSSHAELLPPGETKYFCGFFLDCHVGVAVTSDETPVTIAGRRAAGHYHVMTLRFSSSAVRAMQRPWDIHMHIEDANGVRYPRDITAERALGNSGPLERDIAPGAAYTVQVVFDVPDAAWSPRLFVEQGPALKFPEALLIGDEASLLHRKTYLALPAV